MEDDRNDFKRVSNRKKLHVNKKRFALMMTSFALLFSLGFYIGNKIWDSKNVTVNASEATKNSSTNPQDIMNKRETKVNLDNQSMDSSLVDVYKPNGQKIAYLTFDDGPSDNVTPAVLNILDKYNIKATFFVIGKMAVKNNRILELEAQDGQAIGNHTYSHDYHNIYSSTGSLIDDINKCDITLKSILGRNFNSKIVRFPGGSFGNRMAPFRKVVKDAGYHYIDWNDETGDAEGQNIPVSKLMSELKKYTQGKEHVVILMHDASTKKTTVEALPQVIEYLKSQGYEFKTLK